jgi:hypothetical protein
MEPCRLVDRMDYLDSIQHLAIEPRNGGLHPCLAEDGRSLWALSRPSEAAQETRLNLCAPPAAFLCMALLVIGALRVEETWWAVGFTWRLSTVSGFSARLGPPWPTEVSPSQTPPCRFPAAGSSSSTPRFSVIRRHGKRLRRRAYRVAIDLDPTNDPTHGAQQLSFFNGHFDNWCYLPVLGFVSFNEEAEEYLCSAVLRPGNVTAAVGAVGLLGCRGGPHLHPHSSRTHMPRSPAQSAQSMRSRSVV